MRPSPAWTALAVDVAVAVAATLGVGFAWPRLAAPHDPLLPVATVVPAVVVLLRWATRRTGAATDHGLPAAAAVAVTALMLRERFGVAEPRAVWVGLLALLLAAALGRLLPRLRRLLPAGGRRPDLVFLLLPLGVYLAIQPWALANRPPDGDEPYYLLVAHSLAEDFDTDLADEYRDGSWRRFVDRPLEPQPGDPRHDDGSIRSRHAPFLPLLLAPAYLAAGRAGVATALALCTALAAWLALAVALRRWPERCTGALLAWATLAFTPPMLIYAHQVWIEVPAALCTLAAFSRLDALSRERPRRRDLLVFAGALACLPLLKMRLLLVAVPLLALGLWRLRRWSVGRGLVLAPPLLAVVALLAYNATRFDNPLKMYGKADLRALGSPPSDYLRGLAGMFWDSAFGLFGVAPLWLVLLPALWLLARHRDRLLGELALVGGPYLLAIAPRLEWYGGWSPPFRYPLVLLPLLTLALVPLLDRRTTPTRIALAALAPLTAVLAAIVVAVPGWTYHLADGGSIQLHLLGVALDADALRLFPSTVRWRPATTVWVLATLALAPLVASRLGGFVSRGRASIVHRHAAPLGLVALCLGLTALPLLAQRLPTRTIEVEDWWVRKTRGDLVPERWVVRRPSHRGGWLLPAGGVMTARLAPGGERVTLEIEAARRGFRGPNTLEVRAGDRLLDTWVVEGGAWRSRSIGPVDWPAGAPLVLSNPQKSRRDTVGVIVDRVVLTWHDDPRVDEEADVP